MYGVTQHAIFAGSIIEF